MTDKKKLPLLGKSLMPEILPVPNTSAKTADHPRERVRARMRELLERGTALAAVAGMATACSAYNVVDPLPPPAGTGSGGKAGTGGTSPFPELCPQWSAVVFTIESARWDGNLVRLQLEVQDLSAQPMKPQLESGWSSPQLQVSIGADEEVSLSSDQDWPVSVVLSLMYRCSDGMRDSQYEIRIELDTSSPATTGPVRARIM